ncbi:putative glycosyl hydrolase [Alteromonadaceae bacterium 2753L.S.0a.02]|nr:putative glycosyl hydrolase [Alteromonadaceae bacterium 2753L.S.0a.02]
MVALSEVIAVIHNTIHIRRKNLNVFPGLILLLMTQWHGMATREQRLLVHCRRLITQGEFMCKRYPGLLLLMVLSACASAGDSQQQNTHLQTPLTTQTVVVDINDVTPISPYFYGQNYWNWVRQWQAVIEKTREPVAAMGVQLLRAGGINNDKNNYGVEFLDKPEPFDKTRIAEYIDYTRAIGAAPLLQLSLLHDVDGSPATVESALATLDTFHKLSGRYPPFVSIGNEPDMYVESGDRAAGFDPADSCESFARFATAIRKHAPDVKIVGPDLAWKYYEGNDWLSPFLKRCAEYLDVVTLHRYPFKSEQASLSAAFADGEKFRALIKTLRQTLADHGAADKKLAFTEANIAWDASNTQNSASPSTFGAALWTAETMAVALEEGVWNLSFWHISDGEQDHPWKLGFFQGAKPRPAALVYKLLADNFRTEMYRVSKPIDEAAVFAGANGDTRALLAINKTEHSQPFTVRGFTKRDHKVELAPQSLYLLQINTLTGQQKVIRYAGEVRDGFLD